LNGPRGLTPYLEALEAAREAPGRVAIQLRDKALNDATFAAVTRELVPHARLANVPLLVNERLAIALGEGAQGVHLPERAESVAEHRAMSPAGFWVAASVHDEEGVARRRDADALVLGPFGVVAGKAAPMTETSFARCVANARQPVLALGGIRTSQDVARALRWGAFGIAVQQTISHAPQGGEALRAWVTALNEARAERDLSTKLRG